METSKKRKGLNARGRVAFELRENKNCVSLAACGMSYRTIAQRTGLSVCQVGYRLRLSGTRTTDYRNGRGPMAELVFKKFHIK